MAKASKTQLNPAKGAQDLTTLESLQTLELKWQLFYNSLVEVAKVQTSRERKSRIVDYYYFSEKLDKLVPYDVFTHKDNLNILEEANLICQNRLDTPELSYSHHYLTFRLEDEGVREFFKRNEKLFTRKSKELISAATVNKAVRNDVAVKKAEKKVEELRSTISTLKHQHNSVVFSLYYNTGQEILKAKAEDVKEIWNSNGKNVEEVIKLKLQLEKKQADIKAARAERDSLRLALKKPVAGLVRNDSAMRL